MVLKMLAIIHSQYIICCLSNFEHSNVFEGSIVFKWQVGFVPNMILRLILCFSANIWYKVVNNCSSNLKLQNIKTNSRFCTLTLNSICGLSERRTTFMILPCNERRDKSFETDVIFARGRSYSIHWSNQLEAEQGAWDWFRFDVVWSGAS